MAIEKIILAKPRGFCAGVARAVAAVEGALDVFGAPVYVKHEIVHNKTVVADLAAQGAVTVEDLNSVPDGSVVVFSAHGSSPAQYALARQKNLTVIDATCPLVTKVHSEMKRFLDEGFSVVYIGHAGHIEGENVRAEAEKYDVAVPLIETVADVATLEYPEDIEKIAYLTQTTLSVDETARIIEALKVRYPQIVAPPAKDICFSTTNRQKAVLVLAEKCGVVLVLGSKHSSNSNRLAEVAQAAGVKAYLIDRAEEIEPEWLEGVSVIGITAGASAPAYVVDEVVELLSRDGATVEELEAAVENAKFPLPLIKK